VEASAKAGIGWKWNTLGKRSDFTRNPRDFYPTPFEAVKPLTEYIHNMGLHTYYEPCAGNGALIGHLNRWGYACTGASDIAPDNANIGDTIPWIQEKDATTIQEYPAQFITNPPWDRDILHPIIENLRVQAPTWLLIDADWAHTKQATPYLKYCEKIIAIGRVKWIPGSKHTGKDNCCWYRFVKDPTVTTFIGR
jgi:hypothetical protein